MAIKEVKAGEKYKLELLCIHNSGKVIIFETPTGDHLPFRESDLECVTLVEEKGLYYVEEGQMSFRLKKGDKLLANYWRSHPYAKKAAEAERDRLNAEYRKEQK